MKALIHENKVIQIEEKEFPVSGQMRWIKCDKKIEVGYLFKNGEFVPPEMPIIAVNPNAEIEKLESSITPRRLREAILGIDNGWLSDIDKQIKKLRK